MTKQEIFDTVLRALRKQGRASVRRLSDGLTYTPPANAEPGA